MSNREAVPGIRAALGLAAALVTGSVALAARGDAALESGFLDRFTASWSGSGEVRRRADGSPWSVNCAIVQNRDGNRIALDGSCRAALLFTREIGAHLVFDPETGLYTGTYIGAKVGPAGLSGRRKGDTLVLTITWPKPVNGDTTADLTIRNDGRGRMQIRVQDSLEGRSVTTTDILFTRKAG